MKKNWWKITLLVLAIFACVSIPVILYFTVGQKDNNNSQKVDLNQQNLTYATEVIDMTQITGEEASRINPDMNQSITNKMNNLKLELDADYTISNLDKITTGADLSQFDVIANSVSDSTKATGSLTVTWQIKEDITTRSIQTIMIPSSEEEGLNSNTADQTRDEINIYVEQLLTKGQINRPGVDYQILNLNLIQEGAKFSDYSDQISVSAISSSLKLKGTFKINFALDSSN